MNKNRTIILTLVSLCIVIFLLFPIITYKNGDSNIVLIEPNVKIGDMAFNVTVADTVDERMKGLSGRKELSIHEGLLFVFDKPGIYPFWMKDMNFPIDIIWIGLKPGGLIGAEEDFRVVYIKENASPKSYPETFTPNTPALYVLEVNAGTASDKKIKIGDKVFLNILNGE